ncbi:MAG: hypothetical protein QOI42_482 [Frankiaceae bacterium]|nr:hypothetical protein [Frankiaceae bacterium]
MTSLGVERGSAVDLHGLGDSPSAVRAQKPKWTQFRFLAGVLLVIGSVLLGAKIVAGADKSVLVYAARQDIAPGHVLVPSDVVGVRVRLYDTTAADYLLVASARASEWQGMVAARAIAAGEFVPRKALSPPGPAVDRRVVTVPVRDGHYPLSVRRSEYVDVYVTNRKDAQTPGETTLLLGRVPVGATIGGATGGGLNGGSATVNIPLLVPADKVADVVSAIQGGSIDIVRSPRLDGSDGS